MTDKAASSQGIASPAAGVSAETRTMLWILLIVYIFNFLDRQIVNILAEPIKADLGLSDTQLGLLAGPAFAVFYALLGIPIARYADKDGTNRVRLIGPAARARRIVRDARAAAQPHRRSRRRGNPALDRRCDA